RAAGTRAPFVHLEKHDEPDSSRLYFGKALVYPLCAAPFVRLFGLNGLLVFNVLLLWATALAGRRFLDAQGGTGGSAAFPAAFMTASILPVYAVLLMPEVFTFTLIFAAF